MNPRVLSTLCCLCLWLAASPALAQEPSPSLVLGLRTGFGLPMGLLQGGDGHAPEPLKDRVSGIIPSQLDLGLFVRSRIYVGTSFQYGHLLLADDCPPQIEEGCSARNLRIGVTVSYHLPVSTKVSPWLGLGVGYELFRPWAHNLNGVEFFNVQGGNDFHLGGDIWLGPFVTFTAGTYMNVNEPQPHYWLMGGVKFSLRPAATTP